MSMSSARKLIEEYFPMDGWQTIDTAPRDSTYLLLWDAGAQSMGVKHFFAGHWRDESLLIWDASPTHWMPVPEPPK